MDHEIEPLPKRGALWGASQQQKTSVSDQPISLQSSGFSSGKGIWVIVGTLITVSIIVLGAVAYFIFYGRIAGPSVDIATTPVDEIFVGAPFDFTASFSNFSPDTITNGTATLYLPDSLFFAGQSQDVRTQEVPIAELTSQQTIRRTFRLVSTASVQTVARVRIVFAYHSVAENKDSEFQKEYSTDLLTSRSALDIHIDTPKFAFAGKPFDLTVRYKNNTRYDIENSRIVIVYPNEFVPTSLASSTNGNRYVWNLPKIVSQADGVVALSGTLNGPPNSFFSATALAQIQNGTSTDFYDANSQTATISIYPEPLSVTIQTQGDVRSAALGDQLVYQITATNNSQTTFKDAIISSTLFGELLNRATVSSNGVYDSRQDSITWSPATTPELLALEPGQKVSVSFSVRLNSSFPKTLGSHYGVKVDARITSPTVPSDTAASETSAYASTQTKIAGAPTFKAALFYRDPKNKNLNSGPYPPVVNKPTQFSDYWTITTTGTGLSTAKVITTLQGNTKFIKTIQIPDRTTLSYDDRTKQLIWNIGDVPANTTLNVAFQIETIPAITDVNNKIIVVGQSTLSAFDEFTGNSISQQLQAQGTDIPDDASVGKNRGVVN